MADPNESVQEMRARKKAGAPVRAEKREEINKQIEKLPLFTLMKANSVATQTAMAKELEKTKQPETKPNAAQLQKKKQPDKN